jgi:hypothetical protein
MEVLRNDSKKHLPEPPAGPRRPWPRPPLEATTTPERLALEVSRAALEAPPVLAAVPLPRRTTGHRAVGRGPSRAPRAGATRSPGAPLAVRAG